jgi:6-phosphofructokinase 1
MKVFLCHSSNDSKFVLEVARYLGPCFDSLFYYEEAQRSDQDFLATINQNLIECRAMVIFVGKDFTEYQELETNTAFKYSIKEEKNKDILKDKRKFFIVLLPKVKEIPDKIGLLEGYPKIKLRKVTREEAFRSAMEIAKKFERPPLAAYDLPLDPHLFSYEKDIIKFFVKMRSYKRLKISKMPKKFRRNILNGCPADWPEVEKLFRKNKNLSENDIKPDVIGKFRPESASVVAAALSDFHLLDDNIKNLHQSCMIKNKLCFPEAGPRQYLYFPKPNTNLRVAVIVSGGIAPGINAVIDGITQRHAMYASAHDYNVSIYGLKNGFYAFEDLNRSYVMLKKSGSSGPLEIETPEHASEGGSILGTSRVEELLNIETRLKQLDHIVAQLFNWRVDILYIIGGDGSMKAAHAIYSYAKEYAKDRGINRELSVIAIPKTMDNDILWVWQTFGFMSAVERASQFIESLATEAKSNPRVGVIQLFGSDSGFVVSHAVLASRTSICDAALIPEVDFSMKELAANIKWKISQRAERIPYSLVVLSETAVPTDAMQYIDDPDISLTDDEKKAIRHFEELRKDCKRIQGQTDDFLRNAGLKIVSRGLKKLLPDEKIKASPYARVDWDKLRIFTNEPRHLLRAIPPSMKDIILGRRLGTLAVDNSLAGYSDFMISQWLTEYVLVPLKIVVLGRKRIHRDGIFWKSVVSKTEQLSLLSDTKYDDDGIKDIKFSEEYITVAFKNGREVKTPLQYFPKLKNATQDEKLNWKLSETDSFVYWPDIDEKLTSFELKA